ncbi:MAG: cation:proton antiporter [Rubrimonas sp.]|uniref:cation:proton antiporter n=1 Tax=Rubrimonas sp. TaxID=2036015 RepID=UPI002FDE7633
MSATAEIFDWCVAAALAMSVAALFLGFVRLVLGPTLADRVVAADMVTMILVVTLTLFALIVEEGVYLDAAIALALVGFLATVAFARYIERADRADLAPPSPDFPSGSNGATPAAREDRA